MKTLNIFLVIAAAALALLAILVFAGCESQRPETSRQPHAAPATWESGNPMSGGMGTTNG